MRIARSAAFAALSVCMLAAVANAQLTMVPASEPYGENTITAVYDPATGNLSVNTGAPCPTCGDTRQFNTMQFTIDAEAPFRFDPTKANNIQPPGDVATDVKIFKFLVFGQPLSEWDIGNVLPAGLSQDSLIADLKITGSMAPGTWGKAPWGLTDNGQGTPGLYVVPEPASMGLLLVGLVGLLAFRRR